MTTHPAADPAPLLTPTPTLRTPALRTPPLGADRVRTYDVRTHGCQMNVHDSERLAGLLETAGLVDVASLPVAQRPAVADVVVFNTLSLIHI